jgi:hypothetical protein
MSTSKKIQAAQQRVESASMREALDTLRSIVERLRIPHTKYIKFPGAVQVHWNPVSTKLPTKMVVYLMEKLGFKPIAEDSRPPFREFTNGAYSVLVGPEFGTISLRSLSKEPLTASVAVEAAIEFDEYDSYREWKTAAEEAYENVRFSSSPNRDETALVNGDPVGNWSHEHDFGWLQRP